MCVYFNTLYSCFGKDSSLQRGENIEERNGAWSQNDTPRSSCWKTNRIEKVLLKLHLHTIETCRTSNRFLFSHTPKHKRTSEKRTVLTQKTHPPKFSRSLSHSFVERALYLVALCFSVCKFFVLLSNGRMNT